MGVEDFELPDLQVLQEWEEVSLVLLLLARELGSQGEAEEHMSEHLPFVVDLCHYRSLYIQLSFYGAFLVYFDVGDLGLRHTLQEDVV